MSRRTLLAKCMLRSPLLARRPSARHIFSGPRSDRFPRRVNALTGPCYSEVDLAARASALGFQLTADEAATLQRAADADGDGCVSAHELRALIERQASAEAEKRAIGEVIVKADEHTIGQRLLLATDFVGTALFAIVGTQLAGQAGMNVVGCTLVGCIAAMGGGTVNNLLTGSSTGGVFWSACRAGADRPLCPPNTCQAALFTSKPPFPTQCATRAS